MSDRIKIKYWWSEDKKWFCILTDDGNNQSTVSLTAEEASLLSMNAVLDGPGAPAQTAPKLGEIVTMNQESPYFSDWRGIEMKIVSLRLAPDGKLWASVIERPYNQGYRGYGTYDGETTDIDAAYLSALTSTNSNTAKD